ncbi:hypothetical protein KFU94_65165 [Chloroflexi bacterium TSY]|nr:hypothetical protein [Chloroflexi bacterium TSY]
MTDNGPLASTFGQLIGTGPGRGAALLFITMGALTIIVTIIAYQFPRLRLVEDELPDQYHEDEDDEEDEEDKVLQPVEAI